MDLFQDFSGSSCQDVFCEKVFLKISQYSLEKPISLQSLFNKESSISYVRKIFRKINIYYK